MRTKIKYCIFAFVILFTACSEEAIRVNPSDNSSLHVQVSLPVNDEYTTRAEQQVEESRIDELDVIIFKRVEGTDMYHDYYPVPSFTEETGEDGIHRKIFEMKIEPPEILSQSVGARVMIFANCRDSLEAFLETIDETTATREDFHKGFSMGYLLKNKGGKFPFDTMPMCGIQSSYIVNNGSGEIPYIGVELFRMFARIDIGIDIYGKENSAVREDFWIEEVRVYGTGSKGNVVRSFEDELYNPIPANINIPMDFMRIIDTNWFIVPYEENDGNAMKKMIYVPETEALDLVSAFSYRFVNDDRTYRKAFEVENPVDEGLPFNGTFIILKARSPGESDSYYRIDFVNKYGDYLPLIRNHKYEINITKIQHGGYPTWDYAAMFYYKPNLTRVGESSNSGLEYEISMK